MAEVIHEAQHEFWRPPANLKGASEILVTAVANPMAEACSRCHAEFMIGSRFCHTCGAHRPEKNVVNSSSPRLTSREFVAHRLEWLQSAAVALYQSRPKFPAWLRYLHFHEIKNWIGLPTPSLIAFMIGLGCVVGAIGVSLFYKASNLAEFQAIQMWRIEWLLGATASFVAGILLKKPSGDDAD
jgi:hypothetical protein